MTKKSQEELDAEADDNHALAESAISVFSRLDPANRKAALLARGWHYRLSPHRGHKRLADQYFMAWSAVDADSDANNYDLHHAMEEEFGLRRRQNEESEALTALERRVENLEAMLGQVLRRLPDD